MTITYAMTAIVLMIGLTLMLIDVSRKLETSTHHKISVILICRQRLSVDHPVYGRNLQPVFVCHRQSSLLSGLYCPPVYMVLICQTFFQQ